MEVRTNLSIHCCGDESFSKAFNGSPGVSPPRDCSRSCVALRGDNLECACLGQLSRLASLDSHVEETLRPFPSKTSVASLSVPPASVLQILSDVGREDLA